jgi:hypothetical protein
MAPGTFVHRAGDLVLDDLVRLRDERRSEVVTSGPFGPFDPGSEVVELRLTRRMWRSIGTFLTHGSRGPRATLLRGAGRRDLLPVHADRLARIHELPGGIVVQALQELPKDGSASRSGPA